jgi:hypothetical protein
MTAFPSGVTNNVNTSNLDSATDQPKNARADLLTLTQRVNQMINSFNANSGICGLDAQGKVDSAKLIGQIDTAQIATDAVDGTKIEDNSVDSEHIANGAVDYDHISFGSTATDLGGSTPANNVVPTQAATKAYVDSYVESYVGSNVSSFGSPTDFGTSGTATTSGFLVFTLAGRVKTNIKGGKDYYGGSCTATVDGVSYSIKVVADNTVEYETMTIPIRAGATWSTSYTNDSSSYPTTKQRKFIPFS